MSFVLKDLLGNEKPMAIPQEHQDNLEKLLEKVNTLAERYGKKLKISSGYRSMAKHLQIYKDKGITDQSKVPMKSKHLSGEACDLVAVDMKDFHDWILENQDLMEEIGLWFEAFEYTLNWAHCQIVPPKSGKMFFVP